jgi:4-aminobutyrate aminotransferase
MLATHVAPEHVAAIVFEPEQGEGGFIPAPAEFVEGLRSICDRHGIVLVADEVQSGMGRTGKMWAIEHEGVEPDVLLAGKGIASGMPLGAIVAREAVMTWDVGAHGSTYGGNPVACAAALATLELIEGGLLDNTRDVGELLLKGLRDIQARRPEIVDVRGRGLMIGIEFADAQTMHAVEQAAFRRGLLVLGAGDSVIRMSPPLVFRPDQAETALQVFDDAVADVVGR